mgnify:FL=1|jgi:RimJ/RimL family protein N-acetyltransferase
MEILATKNFIIRNFNVNDTDFDGDDISLKGIGSFKRSIAESYNDELDSEGDKLFVVEFHSLLVGFVAIRLVKPLIFLTFLLSSPFDGRIYSQELLIEMVKFLHEQYPYREINVVVNKTDDVKINILKVLGFKIKPNTSESFVSYSLFLPNKNKK